MDEIFEYNQADIVSLNNKLQPYDKQCNQLIEQLQIMRKVKNDFEKENQEKKATENSSNIPFGFTSTIICLKALVIMFVGPFNLIF